MSGISSVVSKNIVCFVHLPKTGGSSVRRFLHEFGQDYYFSCHTLYDDCFLSYDQANNMFDGWPKTYKYYADHKISIPLVHYMGCKGFSIVRDPVDRFISLYNFINSNTQNTFFPDNILKAVEWSFVQKNLSSKLLSQVRHLTHGKGLEYIEKYLGNFVLIPFENLQDIPNLFGSNIKIVHENQPSNKIVTKIDDNLRKYISRYVEDDLILHKICCKKYQKKQIF